jgi:hypothetical protein
MVGLKRRFVTNDRADWFCDSSMRLCFLPLPPPLPAERLAKLTPDSDLFSNFKTPLAFSYLSMSVSLADEWNENHRLEISIGRH